MGAELIITFTLTAIIMVGLGMIASAILSPKSKNDQKAETYECGIPTEGPSWFQFKTGYYLFAILFLIFDVEAVFLFPWAVNVADGSDSAFWTMIVFIGILGAGLGYAWKKGVLQWNKA